MSKHKVKCIKLLLTQNDQSRSPLSIVHDDIHPVDVVFARQQVHFSFSYCCTRHLVLDVLKIIEPASEVLLINLGNIMST